MSDSLYVSCAQVLSVCQAKKDDLAALLDPETGYAPCMRQVCHDQLSCEIFIFAHEIYIEPSDLLGL
jgi:hypothetical protein